MEFEYVKEANEDLRCSICFETLIDPLVEPACRQMFCESCLDAALKNKEFCPLCNAALEMADTYLPPRVITNALDALLVYCPTCRGEYPRCGLENHITCCPTPCHLGCGEMVAPRDQQTHDGVCVAAVIACPASDVGCPFESKRGEMCEHTNSCHWLALRPALSERFERMESRLAESKAQISKLTRKAANLQQQVDELERRNKSYSQVIQQIGTSRNRVSPNQPVRRQTSPMIAIEEARKRSRWFIQMNK